MKRSIVLLLVLLSFILAGCQNAGSPLSGYPLERVVLGGGLRLTPKDQIPGTLLVIGGTSEVAKGASIHGDYYQLGGNLSFNGKLTGDLHSVGAAVTVLPDAVIEGDLQKSSSTVEVQPGATIYGEMFEDQQPSIPPPLPAAPLMPLEPLEKYQLPSPALPAIKLTGSILASILQALLAMVIAFILPNRVTRAAERASRRIMSSFLVGFIVTLSAPIVLILIILTLIGIPMAALAIFYIAAAVLFGYVSLGVLIGMRLSAAFRTRWHPSLHAGVGTFLLSLLMALLSSFGALGIILIICTGLISLGATLRSRFGRRSSN